VIVEKGETLINCLAYIDLNPYFTDSGVIGSKEFVSMNYQRFKGVFMSKREKIPKLVSGLDGVYSLKRWAE
jgi:putative transposase